MAVKPAKTLNLSGTNLNGGTALDSTKVDITQYSEKVIDYAERLKAKYGNKYTDAYYVDYAKSIALKELRGAHLEIYSNLKNSYEIIDPDWAGYSYEEIIEMENNGYKIPEEVLQWAHAQQQSDVTAYVIVSENALNDVSTTTEQTTDDSSLSNIRTKAIKYITQAENAQKATEQYVEEYKLVAQRANEIKREKEDSVAESMKQITDLTEEWKTLDNKNKSGTLSESDRKRYTELGKMLNGTDGTLMSEIQQDTSDLGEFLNSLDYLSSEIDNNIEISQNVIQAGLELSKFAKNYNTNQQPNVNTGVVFNGTGLLTDVLYGVTGDETADLAIEKGTDLESYSLNLSNELQNGTNTSLSEFAKEYSTLAAQTASNTKATMGEAYNTSSSESDENANTNTDAENEAQQINKDQKGYSVSTNISYQNALQASITTIQATSDLRSQNKTTSNSQKALNKDLLKASQDVSKLSTEASALQQKQEVSLQQEEEFLMELEALQPQSQSQPAEQSVANNSEINNNTLVDINFIDPQDNNKLSQTPETQDQNNENNNNSDEAQTIMAQIEALQAQENSDKERLQTSIDKNVLSSSKAQKSAKLLGEQNSVLENKSANVQKISNDTVFVGSGTFALGMVDTVAGTIMEANGLVMMTNPFTYTSGVILAAAGRILQNKGLKEQIFGTGAVVAGSAGLIAGENSSSDSKDMNSVLKDANSSLKENNTLLNEVLKANGQATVEADTQQENAGSGSETTVGAANQSANSDNTGVTAEQQPQIQNFESQTELAIQAGNSNISFENPEQIAGQNENDQVFGQYTNTENTQAAGQEQDNAGVTNQTQPIQNPNSDQNTTEESTGQTSAEGLQSQTSMQMPQSAETQNTTDDINNSGNTQTQNSEEAQQDSGYSVSIGFSSVNAIAASVTNSQATQDLANTESEVNSSNDDVITQTKKSEDIVKNVEKESAQVQAVQAKNLQQSESMMQEFTTAQSQIQQAETEEEILSSQNQMTSAAEQIDAVVAEEDQSTTGITKSLANSVQQLTSFKNNVQSLNQDITSFDQKISNQSEVSQDTMVVGIGTTAVGVTNTVLGSGLIASGLSMQAFPPTFAAGVAQVALGQQKLAKGILEISTGTAANVVAATGLSANSEAESSKNDAEAAVKNANTQYKNSDKRIQDVNNLIAEDSQTEQLTDIQPDAASDNAEIQASEDVQDMSDEEGILAASAAANTTAGTLTSSDDTSSTVKLERFNSDSIIESKKKKKKVIGVSASSRG